MLQTVYPRTDSSIHLELQDTELWSRFESLSTEMILTKGGRRMFPVLRVAVHGLDPETLYDFKLDFLSCDNYRWRYVSGRWQTNGKQDHTNLNPDRRYGMTIKGEPYSHPKSPNYGRFWMSDVVEFKNVKLTNRANPIKDDHIILNSLHKYKPRIHIFQSHSNGQPNVLLKTFTFPLTSFIAVTAYQNEEITALKIRHNPFAKAFQEPRDRVDYDGQINETDYRTAHFSSLPYYMLPFPTDDSATSSSSAAQVHRHRSSGNLHRSRPYYPQPNQSLMSSNSPPLLLVDQPTPTMFDYANSSTTFPHHHHHHQHNYHHHHPHAAAMSNWSTFHLQNPIDSNHPTAHL